MNAPQFLTEFRHIANAPGGVHQLRQMIYQLAVTGSLTSRSENEEDAGQLLSEIEVERQRLVRLNNYKRMPKLESESIVSPKAVRLPEGWRWSRLLDVGEINPRNEATDDQLAAFIPMSGIPQRHGHPIVAEVKRWGDVKKGYTHFANGDVVLAKITPCFENGKATVISNLPNGLLIGAGTTELQVFRPIHPGILPEYVYLYLRSPLFTVEGEQKMTGTAGQKRVPTNYFATRAFPLPPTEEQIRIVAMVEELMNLCARLEEQQQRRRLLQNALRQSTLHAMADAESPHELEESWQRLVPNFESLFDRNEDVRVLRDVMCDLAMRGVTIPKSKMVNGEILNAAVLRPLSDRLEWKPLSKLTEYITSGSRGWKKYMANEGDSFIRSQDIKHDELIFENPAFVRLPEKAEGMRTLVQPSDLLITITGGNVGRCAVVPDLPQDAYVSQHVALIRLLDPRLSEFIHFWMVNAFGGQAFLARYIYGDKPGLNLKQVGSVLIPVPPIDMLPEILPSLRSYHQMCDQLSDQLEDKLDVSEKFVVAAVNSITGISLVEEGPAAVKVPKTELIAPLRLGATPDVTAQAPLATILARHNGELPARDLWQRFGGEIDAFYAQLKTEVAHEWIAEPAVAEMLEKPAEAAGA